MSYADFGSLSTIHRILYIITAITFTLAQLFIGLISVEIIHHDYSLKQATKFILDRSLIIISALILGLLAIITISLVALGLGFITYQYISMPHHILQKALFIIVAGYVSILMLNFVIRLSFYNFVIILEEKYYIKSFIHSLAYSKGHTLAIALKMLGITAIYVLISLPLFGITYFIIDLLNLPIGNHSKIILSDAIFIIPSQIILIAFYLLYRSYSTGFSYDIKLSAHQIAKLKLAIYTTFAIAICFAIILYLA